VLCPISFIIDAKKSHIHPTCKSKENICFTMRTKTYHPTSPFLRIQRMSADFYQYTTKINVGCNSRRLRSHNQPTSRFFELCKRGDIVEATRRLKTHPQDVYWVNPRDQMTALHYIIQQCDGAALDIDFRTELLLNVLARMSHQLITKQNYRGQTVFHLAVSSSTCVHVNTLEFVLAAINVAIAKVVENVFPFLSIDLILNHIVPFIEDDVMLMRDELGYTALHNWLMWGPYGKYGEHVKFYMRHAPMAAIALNNRGCTPIHLLCRSLASWSHTDSLEAFLANCPYDILHTALRTQDKEKLRTPLHAALNGIFSHVAYPSYEAIRLLLLVNSDIATHSFDGNHETPLDLAQKLGDQPILDLFFIHFDFTTWMRNPDRNSNVSPAQAYNEMFENATRHYLPLHAR